MWQEAAVAYCRTIPESYLEGLAKKSFSKNIRFEGRDLNPRLEREAVIFTLPQFSTEFM
jgi:hypothetical protein